MTIFSADLSLTSTGYAVAINGKVVNYGVIRSWNKTGITRMIYVRQQIMEYVRSGKPEPDLVIMEDLAFGAKGSAVHEHAGLAYMVRAELHSNGIPFVLVSPTSLKKFCCGTAGSPKAPIKKEQVLKEVYKRWGHDIMDNNVADAIVLAYIGMALAGDWAPTLDAQEAVLKTIREKQPLT